MIRNMLLLKDKSILFIEDDTITRTHISDILQMLFGKVILASDGAEAYKLYMERSPDIILTDIKMPNMDGLILIKNIRKNDYDTPIILLTGFVEQELMVQATNLSIDGYLSKPIELEKLAYTLCKALQRTQQELRLIQLGKELFYNFSTKELYCNGNIVELGSKEQTLLQLMINNRHRTVAKEEIGRMLWPRDPICDSAIKNIIRRVRKKLGADIIISVRAIGYRLIIHTN